jgi:hypothetical protein
VFEIDYTDPEVRRIVAQYEDLTGRFERAATEIETEHAEAAKAIQEAADQRDKDSKEFYEQFEKAEKAEEAAPSPWTAPREVKDPVMSFGFDEEERASTWSAPTPPMGFPPPPPIPEPIPEPEGFRAPPVQPTMSIGVFEDEDTAQPEPTPPPAAPPLSAAPKPSGRRRLREDDDDDLSGQSWLS